MKKLYVLLVFASMLAQGQVKVLSNGNVGIGTTSTSFTNKLYIPGGYIYSQGHVMMHAYEGENSSGTAYFQARSFNPAFSINMLIRTQNGNI